METSLREQLIHFLTEAAKISGRQHPSMCKNKRRDQYIDIVVGAPQYVLAIAITILILLVLRSVVLLGSRSRLRGPTQPSPGDDPRQGAPPPSDAR